MSAERKLVGFNDEKEREACFDWLYSGGDVWNVCKMHDCKLCFDNVKVDLEFAARTYSVAYQKGYNAGYANGHTNGVEHVKYLLGQHLAEQLLAQLEGR